MKSKFFVEVLYGDYSEFNFKVELESSENQAHAVLSMITRGTLLASSACKATAYNEDGFVVCSYVR